MLVAKHNSSNRVFQLKNLVFARMNLKPAVFKNFVFDWELSFHLCEVYRFQNKVGLEIPIKNSLRVSLIGANSEKGRLGRLGICV